MKTSEFISQSEASDLIGRDKVSFVDGSWYLPGQKRNARDEYQKMRIPGSVFFDIDVVSDTNSSLPHMLPTPVKFATEASLLGISSEDEIIVYDGPGLFSAARVWWTFTVMGAKNVRVLQGGFDGWKAVNLPVETGNPNPPLAQIFTTEFNPDMVIGKAQLEAAITDGSAIVLDARPEERFTGKAEEPRPGLRSGHMRGAVNLPVSAIVQNGRLIERDHLDRLFANLGIEKNTRVVTSCGSGVTAAILSLALTVTGRTNHALYDGSWAEWGLPEGPAIERNEA